MNERRRRRRGPRRWLAGLVILSLMVFFCGCVGSTEMGDQAMDIGDYSAALDHYEAAIADGDKDPDLYYRAAQAAQRQGAFAKAERYFSQSLRYGGGQDVALALAEFYIQTSNFAKAVPVFQYLIRTEQDLQPLYSNMGTAMMYAGMYIDAESYLLLAQQEDPADPVPYINLGVLYDRHLRNRPKAVRFYDCFHQLSEDSSQIRTVKTRLREIQSGSRIDTSRVDLECGEKYRMGMPESQDLSEVFELSDGENYDDDGPDGEAPIVIERLHRLVTADAQELMEDDVAASEAVADEDVLEFDDAEASEDDREAIDIDKPGAEGAAASDEQQEKQPDATADEDQIAEAVTAFESGRYDEVVDRLEEVSDDSLSADERIIWGRAYYRVGRFDDAAEILTAELDEQPSPELAELLIETHRRGGAEEKMRRICERFAGWPDYEEALQGCD